VSRIPPRHSSLPTHQCTALVIRSLPRRWKCLDSLHASPLPSRLFIYTDRSRWLWNRSILLFSPNHWHESLWKLEFDMGDLHYTLIIKLVMNW